MKEEVASVLLDDEVRQKARGQIDGGDERIPIRKNGIDFRLLKTDYGTSNLEFMVRTDSIRFFQPVGFFTSEGDTSVIHQFEEPLKDKEEVNKLSIRDNAIIGAFEAHTIIEAIKIHKEIDKKGFEGKYNEEAEMFVSALTRFDRTIKANGLKIELNLHQSATPFSELDYKHGIEDTLGIYEMTDDGISFGPSDDTKEDFVRLRSMSLLSALKTF